MVDLSYLTIPVCRGAELSGLRGVARRRSVRKEGRGLPEVFSDRARLFAL